MGATQLFDSLRTAIQSAGRPFGFGPQESAVGRIFTPQLAMAAYLSSGMLRKVIKIPAADRVREWRDWQAESGDTEKLEAEEKRLGIIAKVKAAEVMRGLGGGALVLALPGATNQPAPIVGPRGLQAVNVASRWQLQLVDIDENMASVTYGEPRMFRINGGTAGQQDIHPSRVICFRGDPLPIGLGISAEDAFWGESRLEAVVNEVAKSDNASQWFSELVKKAKLLRISIPNLADLVATEAGQAKLNARVGLIATGESILNATVTDGGDGSEKSGEKVSDFTMTWTGIPAMMDAFDQRIAAVADIPFTRLMGRSPAGMNATGQSDQENWNKMVVAGQKLETRPCLEALDKVLIPSAGVNPSKVTWKFAPLAVPTEKEEADTFDKTMDAVGKLRADASIPDIAMNKAVQNLMSEREWLPGLDQALAEIPEAERFGIAAPPPERDADGNPIDPSAIQSEGGDPASQTARGGDGSVPLRRAANDAKSVPLYVQRKLLNADELIRWAKAQGFKTTLDASDMHVTVLYSRTPVDPIKMGTTWAGNDKGEITITPGGPRAVEKLGATAVVLLFASDDLSWRHRGMVEAGASHDYAEYQPHVTLTYDAGDIDLDAIKPFTGALRFGPELFEPLDLDWKSKITEE